MTTPHPIASKPDSAWDESNLPIRTPRRYPRQVYCRFRKLQCRSMAGASQTVHYAPIPKPCCKITIVPRTLPESTLMARVLNCIYLFQLALLALLGTAPAIAADYYAGRTVEFVVGAASGGGYDIYARAVSRHLGRHILGAPTIVVKNMPGAGSAKAAQYITGIAPKDGTSIAGIMPGAIMGPLLDDRTAPLFDPTKVRYVGTANSGVRVCVTLKGNRIGSFA